jgi:hypothetical protein
MVEQQQFDQHGQFRLSNTHSQRHIHADDERQHVRSEWSECHCMCAWNFHNKSQVEGDLRRHWL